MLDPKRAGMTECQTQALIAIGIQIVLFREAFQGCVHGATTCGFTMFTGDPAANARIWLNTSLNCRSHSS